MSPLSPQSSHHAHTLLCFILALSLNPISAAFSATSTLAMAQQFGASALVYSTFLGGSLFDEGRGIAWNGSGGALASGKIGLQSPGLPRYVGVIGCSNSKQIEAAYTNVSTEYRTWLGAQGGGSLDQWAINNNSYWQTFDSQLAIHSTTNIWWPICVKTSATISEADAWNQFSAALANLRQRTQVPLYLTPSVGSQPSCSMDNDALQLYVANKAVLEGLALRGPDIPPASNPTSDQCHFDPVLSTNIGFTARDFIDGIATPTPTPTPTPIPTPTPNPTPTPGATPAAPSKLTAQVVSASQINLAWVDNSGNESGFNIERCTGNNCVNFAQVGQVGPYTTGFVDGGLYRNTTYRYRVRAFNVAGNSGYSNIASVSTLKR